MKALHSSTKQFVRGGHILLHQLHLLNALATRIFLLGGIVFLLFLASWCCLRTSPYERYLLAQGLWAHLNLFLNGSGATQRLLEPNGGKLLVYSNSLLHSLPMQNVFHRMSAILWSGFWVGFLFTTNVLLGVAAFLKKRGKKEMQAQHLKCDTLLAVEALKKKITRSHCASDFAFGKNHLAIIRGSEKQHFLFDGTTGSGKSNAIKELLEAIRRRGDRAIVWDEGGHYLQEFYNEGQDKLLNALDARGFSWHLWDECQDVADFENLAAALIPMVGVQDPFWVLGARTIFSEMAFALRKDPERSVQKLLKFLLTASLEHIKTHLENTLASTLVSDKIEKTAISIKSVMAAYLKCLRYVKDEADPFSIRRWIQAEKTTEWLFITSLEKKHEALKPLITAWLDIAINELLSLPEHPERCIWIILDELASLHKIPTLFKVLSKSRKCGGCVVIGIQNYAQLADVYGSNGAQIISSLLNTRFLFRQPDPEMAAWSARNLGESIQKEVREGISHGSSAHKDGVSLQRVETRKPVVSPSEMMTLENLQCFVRLPGAMPITKLMFDYRARDSVNVPFIPRDFGEVHRDLDDLLKKYEAPGFRQEEAEESPPPPDGVNSKNLPSTNHLNETDRPNKTPKINKKNKIQSTIQKSAVHKILEKPEKSEKPFAIDQIE